MEKMVVVVFNNQPKALEGWQTLRELDKEGEISLYEVRIVAKEPSGHVRVIDNADVLAFPMIAGSTVVGTLVGLLGGPLGAFIGASGGALIGAIGDAEEVGVTEEFVNDIKTALTPGKVALVAEIDEEWVTPLDTRMERIGGSCSAGQAISLRPRRTTRCGRAPSRDGTAQGGTGAGEIRPAGQNRC